MSPYESSLDAAIDHQSSVVSQARSVASEARRNLTAGRSASAVEENARAQAELAASEHRLAKILWERDMDATTIQILQGYVAPDEKLVKLTHRDTHGAVCDECVSAGLLILRGNRPPAGWLPSCGSPFNAYSESG